MEFKCLVRGLNLGSKCRYQAKLLHEESLKGLHSEQQNKTMLSVLSLEIPI